MIKLNCNRCGRLNIAYSPPRFCQYCHAIFAPHNEHAKIDKPVKLQPEIKKAVKKPVKIDDKVLRIEAAKRKKPLSAKQKQYYNSLSDAMQSTKTAMVNHILDKIKSGYYEFHEFKNDPAVYFDKNIMGKFNNNSVMKKSIIREVEYEIFGMLL